MAMKASVVGGGMSIPACRMRSFAVAVASSRAANTLRIIASSTSARICPYRR
jgi:hypothetical protein